MADESRNSEVLAQSLERLEKVLDRLEKRLEELETPGRQMVDKIAESAERAYDNVRDNIIESEIGRQFGRESRAKTEEYKLNDFTGIDIGGSFEVEITRADSYSVSLTAEEGLFRNLVVSNDQGILRIGHSRHIGWKAQITRPRAKITLPALKELRLHGASRAEISGFNSAEPLRLKLSGASRVSGDITAGNSDFELSGASRAELTGSANNVSINSSGAIHLALGDFSVHNVSVKMSGVCHGVIKMDGRLDARLSGVSHFNWLGNPEMGSIRTSGHSSLGKA